MKLPGDWLDRKPGLSACSASMMVSGSFATETAPELERLEGFPGGHLCRNAFSYRPNPTRVVDRRIAVERSLGYLPPEIKREVLIQLPLVFRSNERLDRACDRHKAPVDMGG